MTCVYSISIDERILLVFADLNTMKLVMIYIKVRRDINNGTISDHKLSSVDGKNRFNILTTINLKGWNIRHVKFVILEECTDFLLFLQFFRHLPEIGVLL